MSGGRPRTRIGTYGVINVRVEGRKHVASTRVRDQDGKLRRVVATGPSKTGATALLKEKILERPRFGSGSGLDSTSSFVALSDMWLDDLEKRVVAVGTRDRYRDILRLHVRPAFENFKLNEITTSRVESFLKTQYAASYSRAKNARTLLNLIFEYAMRHDAMVRNPVSGTSPLVRPKGTPQALTLAQIAAIRVAAKSWRSAPGLPGPRPDGQVRDIIEVLLGTGMRPGEVLALRPCDVFDQLERGMVVQVTGTVVQPKGRKAFRQDRPKTPGSVRTVPVPDFAAAVLRSRLRGVADEPERTIFANRSGGVLSPPNVRRTFREFLRLAGLEDSGISLRWYRRTVATVVARGMSSGDAATFLGHSSSAITEGHYIEPESSVDRTPTLHIQRTLRAVEPDPTLLAGAPTEDEADMLDEVDPIDVDEEAGGSE